MDDLVFLAFDLQGVQVDCVELAFTLFGYGNNDVIAVDQGLICGSASKVFIGNGLDREEATSCIGDKFTGKIGRNIKFHFFGSMYFKHDDTSLVELIFFIFSTLTLCFIMINYTLFLYPCQSFSSFFFAFSFSRNARYL